VVVRRVRKWIREERRHRELLREARVQAPPSTPIHPDDAAGARRLAWRLDHALGALPERQRLCLQLVQFEALSARAVAERLGVTPDAVRMIVHRARTELRRKLAEDADG
jgi:RNA polymerase sigma-70 factor (ECF subfamily)